MLRCVGTARRAVGRTPLLWHVGRARFSANARPEPENDNSSTKWIQHLASLYQRESWAFPLHLGTSTFQKDLPVPWGVHLPMVDYDVFGGNYSVWRPSKVPLSILRTMAKFTMAMTLEEYEEGMKQVYRKLVDIYNGEGWLCEESGKLLCDSVEKLTPFADSELVLPALAEVLDKQLQHTLSLGYLPRLELVDIESAKLHFLLPEWQGPVPDEVAGTMFKRIAFGMQKIFDESEQAGKMAMCSGTYLVTHEKCFFVPLAQYKQWRQQQLLKQQRSDVADGGDTTAAGADSTVAANSTDSAAAGKTVNIAATHSAANDTAATVDHSSSNSSSSSSSSSSGGTSSRGLDVSTAEAVSAQLAQAAAAAAHQHKLDAAASADAPSGASAGASAGASTGASSGATVGATVGAIGTEPAAAAAAAAAADVANVYSAGTGPVQVLTVSWAAAERVAQGLPALSDEAETDAAWEDDGFELRQHTIGTTCIMESFTRYMQGTDDSPIQVSSLNHVSVLTREI